MRFERLRTRWKKRKSTMMYQASHSRPATPRSMRYDITLISVPRSSHSYSLANGVISRVVPPLNWLGPNPTYQAWGVSLRMMGSTAYFRPRAKSASCTSGMTVSM